ncbi:CaiB/BaiF CoA transferase family protein [Salipiger sp.]|uniref:CaiB/BaiF CoA transferase family protein n=1 Tax=Salipiger sp. TaxID=2078585 RepID=UPI003A980484
MTGAGALAGIRVLDFSTLLPGPMASLFLAEAGAEVIKVERPGRGDEMRSYDPKAGEDSGNFHLLNRGKKSVALNLKDPEDLARLRPLLESADILIEQYRPGVMARLGLSYEDVSAVNRGIIYCSITGYGQTGPRSLRAGHDLNYQAETGMLALGMGPPGAPSLPPALVADVAGGTYPALLNILLALRRRDATGAGACLDIAMADNLFPFLYWAQADGQLTGRFPGNGDSLVTGGSCRYRLYPSSDGVMIAVAALEQVFWDRFCDAIGLQPDLRDDAVTPEATGLRVADILGTKPSCHWEETFEAADCCCSLVRTLPDAMKDAHFRARGVFGAPDASALSPLPTPLCPALRAENSRAAAPKLGEDTGALAPRGVTLKEDTTG